MTRELSSWPPSDARYCSSCEKERDWIKTLCNFILCTISRVSKSQMMMSA